MTTALSGAAQGASAGMMFGPWGAAIGAGIGFLAGSSAAKKADKQLAKAIQFQSQQQLKEMALQQAELYRQQAVAVTNTETAINYIKYSTGQVMADISVQNAMSDAIGASAAAVYADAATKSSTEKAMAFQQLDQESNNIEQGLYSALRQSYVSTTDMLNYYKSQDTTKQDNVAGLLGLASTAGSMYSRGMFKADDPTINMQGQNKALYNNPAFVRNM
jgi:hypothetical protein